MFQLFPFNQIWFCFIFYLMCVAILFFLVRMLYEPYKLVTEYISLPVQTFENQHSASIRVLLFTDLHAGNCRISDKKLIREIFSKDFDLLLFGGDICNSNRDSRKALKRLHRIGEKATELQIPCYAVRGNHDMTICKESFDSTCFRLLENESIRLKDRAGKDFLLIGMDDLGKRQGPIPSLPIHPENSDIPVHRRILLVHKPTHLLYQLPGNYAFQLSGHNHGGQLRLPFSLEYRLFRNDALTRIGIRSGFFEKNQIQGYISRGCGCVLLPIRFLCKPEITVIDFYLDETSEM